jgi:dTDP-4-dehydrorhamnose reductase
MLPNKGVEGVVIIGHTGMIGMEQIHQLNSNYHIIGISRSKIEYPEKNLSQIQYGEVHNMESRIRAESINIKFIINNLAISDYLIFQSNPGESFEFNIQAAKVGLHLADRFRSKLIYTSTDSVYEGNDETTKLNEEITLSPKSFYARSKVKAEMVSRQSKLNLITRGNFYGKSPNTRKGLIDRLNQDRDFTKIQLRKENYLYSPLWVKDYVRYQISLINKGETGTVNIGSRDAVTRAAFVQKYLKLAGKDIPSISNDNSQDNHSTNLTLNVSRLRKILNQEPKSVDESLRESFK